MSSEHSKIDGIRLHLDDGKKRLQAEFRGFVTSRIYSDALSAYDTILHAWTAAETRERTRTAELHLARMTLRDQFAMAALTCLTEDGFGSLAADAYRIADAMLAERERIQHENIKKAHDLLHPQAHDKEGT